MKRLRKYLALTPAARAVVLRSLLLLPAVAAILRALGMARTTALLERLGSGGECDPRALAPQEIARLVEAAASLLGSRCLPQSLVLWHFLRHRRGSAEVRLGVSKLADGSLTAHAWLEFHGLPLNEHADLFEHYAAFASRRRQIPH